MSRRRRKTYRIKVLSPRPDQSRHGCTYVWVDSYLAFSREIINKLLDLPNVKIIVTRQRRSIMISVPDWYWQDYRQEILTALAIDISHPWEMNPRGYRVHVTELQCIGDAKISVMNDGITLKRSR